MTAGHRDGMLVLSDLRMGAEPDYSFRFLVAGHDGHAWHEVAPRQLRWPWQARGRLSAMWRRIWTPGDPTQDIACGDRCQAAAGRSGATPAISASK